MLHSLKRVNFPFLCGTLIWLNPTYLLMLFSRIHELLLKSKDLSKRKGIWYVVRLGLKMTFVRFMCRLLYWYYIAFRSARTFTFQGRHYNYFFHSYNTTWNNERTVEVPIVRNFIGDGGKRILEVGNVLSHYFHVNYDVIDKYEKAHGVINEDVVDFQPSKKYDLIVSISTLEHVGWDENSRDPKKILKAIENLRRCLAPKGKIVATLPLGFNPEVDRLIEEKKIGFTRQYCLKRVSPLNKWVEVSYEEIKGSKIHDPFPNANGLVVGVIEKEE